MRTRGNATTMFRVRDPSLEEDLAIAPKRLQEDLSSSHFFSITESTV